jgi:hypothetical protein
MHLRVVEMLKAVKTKGRPLQEFHAGDTIHVSDKMTKNYTYTLTENPGQNLAFQPYADPDEILCAGAFEGKYLNDCIEEFPAEWFLKAIALGKLSPQGGDVSLNAFEEHSRLPLSSWQKSGWVPGKHISKKDPILSDPEKNPDIRGWFQWYCRYWMGRRLPELDEVQIKRWRAFTRHAGAIRANCDPHDLTCRPRQRQALLHWAYNPYM